MATDKQGRIKKADLKHVQETARKIHGVRSENDRRAMNGIRESVLINAGRQVQILRTREGRPEHQLSPFEKIELVENGISKKDLENLKQKANLDYDQLSKVLNVARTTLLAKKGKEKFNSDLSDKILGLADIYSYGYEVFEDRERFNEWIFRPNKALGGQAPFDILHNSFGRDEVRHLIGRIDHGVYS